MSKKTDSTGKALPPIEVPSADRLRVYGDMAFLAFRSPRHQGMSVAELRRYMEPPIELGQFRIFRFDDVPRGMYTWAFLSRETEEKLIAGAPLEPDDWRSGDRLWVIDLLAPYRSLTWGMVRWIMVPGNLTNRDFRFRRVGADNTTRRIVHVNFRDRVLARVFDEADYLRERS